MATHEGIISYFNDKKGYGFISLSKDQRVFVHFSAIKGKGYKTLKEGEKVAFELKKNSEGQEEARNVRKL